VKNRCGQRCIAAAAREHLQKMRPAPSPRRKQSPAQKTALLNRRGQFRIEPRLRAVTIHRREQNLSRSHFHAALCPFPGVERCRLGVRREFSPAIRRASRASRQSPAPPPAPRIPRKARLSSSGHSTAAVFTVILSAPARTTARAASSERIPPPAVNGMANCSATPRIVSRNVGRLSRAAANVEHHELIRALRVV